MTEDENCPPPIIGVLNTPNIDAENYFYTSANLYYHHVGHPPILYERNEDTIDVLSRLPEVEYTRRRSSSSSSSAFRPVNPGGEATHFHSAGGHLGNDFGMKDPSGAPLLQPKDHQHHQAIMTSGGGMKGKQKYNSRYPLPEKPRQKRAVIQDMVRPLKQWLVRHRHNPYPTKTEKVQLALGSNMTLVQVSNWFANARRRLKNVVQDHRCSWSKRLRMYNQFVQGNAELLSIASDDSIWNSEDEEDCDSSNRKTGSSGRGMVMAHEEDSCGRTPVSSADGNEDSLQSPSLGKDGSPKYKTSILHRYLADSLESAVASQPLYLSQFAQKQHHHTHHLPIRPVPSRDERLYRPYKVLREKKISESSQKDEEDTHLVVVDDDDEDERNDNSESKKEADEKAPVGFPSLNPSHLPPAFPLWHHSPFPLGNPLFSPFLASSTQKDLLKLLYNDAILSRSKDLAAMSNPPGSSLPVEPISTLGGAPEFPPSIPPADLSPPIKSPNELLNKISPTQTTSSTPAIFI